MPLPAFLGALPRLDLPLPWDQATCHTLRSEADLMVLSYSQGSHLAAPQPRGQWGKVIEASLKLSVDRTARTYGREEIYDIPAGVEHTALLPTGAVVLDILEEPDRYPIRP